MWSYVDRIGKVISDVTVGTVIVLVHVALADRRSSRRLRSSRPDGTSVWHTQISP